MPVFFMISDISLRWSSSPAASWRPFFSTVSLRIMLPNFGSLHLKLSRRWSFCTAKHFDLKGSNLMVDQCRCLKVIDFGLSEVVRGPLTSRKESTAHYLAPEVMFVNRRLAADVWSLGVNLYYFWMARLPFAQDEGLPFDIYNIVLYDYHDLPDYGDFGHDALLAVIRRLLRRQPFLLHVRVKWCHKLPRYKVCCVSKATLWPEALCMEP